MLKNLLYMLLLSLLYKLSIKVVEKRFNPGWNKHCNKIWPLQKLFYQKCLKNFFQLAAKVAICVHFVQVVIQYTTQVGLKFILKVVIKYTMQVGLKIYLNCCYTIYKTSWSKNLFKQLVYNIRCEFFFILYKSLF